MPATNPRPKKNPAHTAYERAIKLLYKGDYSKAQKSFESILERYPEQKQVTARIKVFLRLCEENRARPAAPPKSPAELYDAGVYEHNRGQYEAAIEFFKKALKKAGEEPNPGAVHGGMAASYARMGAPEEALQNLEKAIEADEVNRFHAQHDPDFESLGSNDEFRGLVGGGKRVSS